MAKSNLASARAEIHGSRNAPIGSKPAPFKPEPKQKEESVPDIRDQVSRKTADVFMSLVETSMDLKSQIDVLERERMGVTATLKKLVSDNGIEKAVIGDCKLAYYNAPRTSISRAKLLDLGVKQSILDAATEKTDVFTLKISRMKEGEE